MHLTLRTTVILDITDLIMLTRCQLHLKKFCVGIFFEITSM